MSFLVTKILGDDKNNNLYDKFFVSNQTILRTCKNCLKFQVIRVIVYFNLRVFTKFLKLKLFPFF